jgi:hypothetical protein
VVDFEGENRETVYRPGWTLGIESSILLGLYGRKLIEEKGIDLLDSIRTLLIPVVNLSFNFESFYGIDMGIADNIFEIPLDVIYPVLFEKEIV